MSTENNNLPKLAFLGPLGSHSYQCARDGFGTNVEYVEKPTISGVFDAVASETALGLIPQENSIFGTVMETYDLLRLPEAGKDKFVRGELTLPVHHSLLVRRGVKLEDVRRVLSHEQALGQCAHFLSEHLPGAARVKMPSTSAAAQALLSDEEDDQALQSAAISSAVCATVFDGLEVVQENIQDSDTNRTRFYVLANSLDVPLPSESFQQHSPKLALVRISENVSEQDAPPRSRLIQLIISTLLTTFGSPATRVDRRPPLNGTAGDVYMFELENSTGLASPDILLSSDNSWISRVRAGIERIQVAGGNATLLGVW